MANWTPERIHAYESCQQAFSNCQELYFLDDTAAPIVQTDASDYGIGGYVFMVTNCKVLVIRYFCKALQGAHLNRSAREKECYTIYYGVKQFEDHLHNRQFILKTDYKNLTYINVTLLGRCCGGNFTFRIKTSISCMFLGKKYINMCLMRCHAYARTNMPPKPVVDAPMPILIGHTSLKVERPLCLLNGR